MPGGVELIPRTRALLSLAGMLRAPVRAVTVEEMDAGIAEAVAEEHERTR